MDEQDIKLGRTPADIIKLLMSRDDVSKVELLEFYDKFTVVIVIKFTFWVRFWMICNGDFKDKLKITLETELNEFLPAGLIAEIVITV